MSQKAHYAPQSAPWCLGGPAPANEERLRSRWAHRKPPVSLRPKYWVVWARSHPPEINSGIPVMTGDHLSSCQECFSTRDKNWNASKVVSKPFMDIPNLRMVSRRTRDNSYCLPCSPTFSTSSHLWRRGPAVTQCLSEQRAPPPWCSAWKMQ